MRKYVAAVFVAAALVVPAAAQKVFNIAVFVPGIVKGSPTYEMLVAGVKDAQKNAPVKVRIKVVEGGRNQGEWLNAVTALALSKKYQLIVSSNPSLPAIAEKVLKAAPDQKFLLMDGFLVGNSNIKTIGFDQYEQGYINGYYAALISSSDMKHARKAHKIGLLAGQEFPVMNNSIRKGFLDGAQAVHKDFELDFRVLGNWYDASKAASLASSMIRNDVDVILTICGGGNAGTVAAARENGAYVTWFDSPGYHYGEEIVVGGTKINLKEVCSKAVLEAITGSLDYGNLSVLGTKDGAVDFVFDGIPQAVPQEIIQKQKELVENMKKGTHPLPRQPYE